MTKTRTLTRITAAILAVITAAFTFCVTSFATQEKSGADLYIGSEVMHFEEISDAWSKAVESDKKAKLVLNEDWTADENGSFGEGEGFINGGMYVRFKNLDLTIDLNGFRIDRGLKGKKDSGNLFCFERSGKVVFTDSSEAKTGMLTGGFSKIEGGAVVVLGSEVRFENITIANNKTSGKGGAIYLMDHSPDGFVFRGKVTLDNCKLYGNEAKTGGAIYADVSTDLMIFDTTITGNKATNDAGIHTELNGFYKPEVTLGGKVVIADNIAEKDGTGIMLDENVFWKIVIGFSKQRPLDDESRIVVLSKTGDKTLRITKNSDDDNIGCFEYENSKYSIVAKGSGDSRYLDIKKN